MPVISKSPDLEHESVEFETMLNLFQKFSIQFFNALIYFVSFPGGSYTSYKPVPVVM